MKITNIVTTEQQVVTSVKTPIRFTFYDVPVNVTQEMIDECIKYVNEETSFPANCFQPVELQVAIANYGDYGVIPDSVTGSTWFRFLKHCKLDVFPQHSSKTQVSESDPVIVKSISTYKMFGKGLNGALSLQISPKKVQPMYKGAVYNFNVAGGNNSLDTVTIHDALSPEDWLSSYSSLGAASSISKMLTDTLSAYSSAPIYAQGNHNYAEYPTNLCKSITLPTLKST